METNVIIHEGKLNLGGSVIECYILQDGTRVLSGREMQRALKMVDDDKDYQVAGSRLQRHLDQKSLSPFLYQGKPKDHYTALECFDGNKKISGYEASVLVDICDAFMQARKDIELSPRQKIVADQCEILIRSFAKVGLVALIDEATGYQYQREHNELQKILRAYISDEVLKWQLTFTDSFYKQVFRLWNYEYTAKGLKKKPQFVGVLTNKYIYEQLPDGVLEVLKEKTPKTPAGHYSRRLHQSLTRDIGKEHLKKQIIEVTTLMEIANNKDEFIKLFEKKYNINPQQELDLAFKSDKGT